MKGVNACPTGYDPIYDVQTCIKASDELGLTYNAKKTDKKLKSDSVCNLCGWCTPNVTRVTKKHKQWAKWLCQKRNTLFKDKFLDILFKIKKK